MDANTPFPQSTSSAGTGWIVAVPLPGGGSGTETISYQYPLKLISPSSRINQASALVFLLSYGGGLVGGDVVNLSVNVQPKARLSLVTQGHTKIFKTTSEENATRQSLDVVVGDNGALCLLPDPVQPFEGSAYVQTQVFKVTSTSTLCLLDWVSQGRKARGEDWSFLSWTGRNEVWLVDADKPDSHRLLIRDTQKLSQSACDSLGQSLKENMHILGVFGTLILWGNALQTLATFFLDEFAALPRLGGRDFRSLEDRAGHNDDANDWRSQRIRLEREHGVIWSAAQVRGCVVVKFGSTAVEGGRAWLSSMLLQEGTVADIFGDQALLCIH